MSQCQPRVHAYLSLSQFNELLIPMFRVKLVKKEESGADQARQRILPGLVQP